VAGISGVRLWEIPRRFFAKAAEVIEADNEALAEKLLRASPNWTRHIHATHAIACGAELTTVGDNLRNASMAITSIYPHSDGVKRARHRDAFAN
jgi:site-specific recombinase XerD